MMVQIPCPNCGGGGVLGIVTRDMAMDAGDLRLEGEYVLCDTCAGSGNVTVTVDDEGS